MDGGIREWLAGLSRRELALLMIVVVAALAGAGLWYARSLPQPVALQAEAGPRASPTATPVSLFVHVAGWVRRPGVYELREGARIIDALEMAGGPRPKADLTMLNLAAVLTDGQQIVVPRPLPQAQPPPAAVSPAGASVQGGVAAGGTTLVNVNTATAADLETLPGIGPVLAQRIVDFREQNGPFTAVDQLEEVSGIGPVTMEGLRDLVTV